MGPWGAAQSSRSDRTCRCGRNTVADDYEVSIACPGGQSPRYSTHLCLARSALRVVARTRGLAFDALRIPAGRGYPARRRAGPSVENEKHPWMTCPRWYPQREKRTVGFVRSPGTDRSWRPPLRHHYPCCWRRAENLLCIRLWRTAGVPSGRVGPPRTCLIFYSLLHLRPTTCNKPPAQCDLCNEQGN